MESRSPKQLPAIALFIVLIIAGGGLGWGFHEDEYLRIPSPGSKYVAIVTCRRFEALLPIFPGGSGDKSGFIRIERSDGTNFGKIPVPMVSMTQDLEWTSTGAYLTLVGEWDFPTKEYRWWNEAGTHEIVKRAR
jgi:hypothetical protein